VASLDEETLNAPLGDAAGYFAGATAKLGVTNRTSLARLDLTRPDDLP
jgi:hypothetical protein